MQTSCVIASTGATILAWLLGGHSAVCTCRCVSSVDQDVLAMGKNQFSLGMFLGGIRPESRVFADYADDEWLRERLIQSAHRPGTCVSAHRIGISMSNPLSGKLTQVRS